MVIALQRELDTLTFYDELQVAAPFLAAEMIMLPHQQRVVDEKLELGEKIASLQSFISSSPFFEKLDEAEKDRLRRQKDYMIDYWNVLMERIDAFTN